MVIFVTADLMILSNARAALPAGDVLKQASTVQRLHDLTDNDEIRLVLVDLQTPGLKLEELETVLASADLLGESLLFAQHVNVKILERARDKFPRVMTRGQVHSKLTELLRGS